MLPQSCVTTAHQVFRAERIVKQRRLVACQAEVAKLQDPVCSNQTITRLNVAVYLPNAWVTAVHTSRVASQPTVQSTALIIVCTIDAPWRLSKPSVMHPA